MEIQTSPSEIPAGYEHYFNNAAYLEQMRSKSVEEAFLDVCREIREMSYTKSSNAYGSRSYVQIEHDMASQAKADAHLKKTPLYLDIAGVVCAIASGFAGGANTGWGAAFNGAGQGFSSSSTHFGKGIESEIEGKNHLYGQKDRIITYYTQSIQEAQRAHGEMSSQINSIIRDLFRLFESAVQSTS